LEGCSEKIGGPNRTVEIDKSKFSRRKYHRGHPVKGQWVFGGIERESGRTFLVPVPDRTAPTLVRYIREWIKPGTTIISDCWAAYREVGSIGYSHRTVNRSVSFVNPETGDHTNTVESMWRAVKQFLRPYNKQEDYDLHLAHYMFAARYKATGIPPFNQFLAIVASTDWANCSPPTTSIYARHMTSSPCSTVHIGTIAHRYTTLPIQTRHAGTVFRDQRQNDELLGEILHSAIQPEFQTRSGTTHQT
jgi:transposase-like protein